MVNIRAQPPRSPPAGEVGEIDTAAPFQSVRAAVSLFGAVASIKGKASLPSFKRQPSVSENAKANSTPSANTKLSAETRLMLATKDITKYKTKLDNAESAKTTALDDLETVKQSLDDLNTKIISIQESKHAILESTDAVKQQALKLQEEISRDNITLDGPSTEALEREREQYALVTKELDATKRYLAKIRHDFDAAMDDKMDALHRASDAHCATKTQRDKAIDLKNEIASTHESIESLKLETVRSSKMKVKILAERESLLQSYKPAKDEAERKLKAMKKEFNPEMARILEQQYEETTSDIRDVKEQMRIILTSEMTSVKDISDELTKSKNKLQELSSEENRLRELLDSLATKLESVKKEIKDSENRQNQMTTSSNDLHQQLTGYKAELESLSESHEDEHFSKLHRLLSGTNAERRAEQEIRKNIAELKKETENFNNSTQEATDKLRDALAELEEAEEQEKSATDRLKNVSTVCSTDFGPGGAKMRMSKKDHEALSRKPEEMDNLAEMKVAAVMFQVGAISGKKNGAESQVETTLKEIDRMQAVIEFALKQADASEASQKQIEAEIERWRKEG